MVQPLYKIAETVIIIYDIDNKASMLSAQNHTDLIFPANKLDKKENNILTIIINFDHKSIKVIFIEIVFDFIVKNIQSMTNFKT